MFATVIQAIVLGIVQGMTEFIPISSSAHLIIVPWLFGWNDPALTSLSFDVALHLGTLLAVLIFFGQDWIRLIGALLMSMKERKIGSDPDRRMAWYVVIGTIPGGIVGLLAESKIEALFHQPGVPIAPKSIIIMAIIIALLGSALFIADQAVPHDKDGKELTLKEVIIIGFAQALAIFPGVSRSGSTITAGLALGLKRDAAAKFSFLLSAPIIAGAGLKSLFDVYHALKAGSLASSELLLFPIGLIVAAISGYLCIGFLLKYLQNHKIDIFVYYRWVLAVFITGVALAR